MPARDYLSKFHLVQDIRVHLTLPARDVGELYASDGHILIVVDDDPDVRVLENSTLSLSAKKVMAPIDSRDNWIPVDMTLPSPIGCFICAGVGKLTECVRCDGVGVIESDNGTEEEQCPRCNGAPSWPDPNGKPCWKCDGSGEDILAIPVGNTHFQRRYLALLQSLPGPVSLSTGPVASDVAFFRFAEGCGALMPCRP